MAPDVAPVKTSAKSLSRRKETFLGHPEITEDSKREKAMNIFSTPFGWLFDFILKLNAG